MEPISFKHISNHEFRITLPTKFTIFRILIVPFLVFFMFLENWLFSFILIILGALSDLLDGILARKWNEKTLLGACLDPIADKFFILSVYFVFAMGHIPNFYIPSWFIWLVFIKEILLILGAIIFFKLKGFYEIKPSIFGKLTMDAQVIFIFWIFLSHFFNIRSIVFFEFLLTIIVILVLTSLFQYATIGFRQLLLQGYIQNKP